MLLRGNVRRPMVGLATPLQARRRAVWNTIVRRSGILLKERPEALRRNSRYSITKTGEHRTKWEVRGDVVAHAGAIELSAGSEHGMIREDRGSRGLRSAVHATPARLCFRMDPGWLREVCERHPFHSGQETRHFFLPNWQHQRTANLCADGAGKCTY